MSSAGEPTPDPRILDLVAQCLDALEREDTAEIERIYKDNPDVASAIEERVARLRKLGIATSAWPEPGVAKVGPYRVLDFLGEGGMGAVYLCEQREPVRRRLAVKVIKRGMDTTEVLRRFDLERRALALMDHPNIAKVFDAGSTEDGRPYIAMEAVQGAPITEYCERTQLDITARLNLFALICDAVQHAHQKGIIHRDLKPSNVLVTEVDDRPVPKVIDFGVAKATHASLSPATLYTEPGKVIGTLEYMSPEQAGSSTQDIDTRTDVYALGMMLYRLLAGRLPFDQDSGRGTPTDILAAISETAAPAPSSRLGADSKQQALARRLRGDLDWIVLKAIEKERSRRYGTAAELAADVRRHLADEPVTAGAPSRWYRLKKLVRRNRVAVLAGTVAILGLVGGTIALAVAGAKEAQARANLEDSQRRFRLLTLVEKLRIGESKAAKLIPPWPESIAKAEAWLTEFGDPVAGKLPDVKAALTELKERLEKRGSAAAQHLTAEQLEADRFLRDRLSELQPRLQKFANDRHGALTTVKRRLAWSRSVQTASIDNHADAWKTCQQQILADPRYDGLQLQPQLGLVPLGADPKSKLQEFAHLASGNVPRRAAGTGALACGDHTGMVFVLLPPGTFWMGAQRGDPDGHNYDPRAMGSERPVHQVTVPAFFLSKWELSRGQWIRITGKPDPSTLKMGVSTISARSPVESITFPQIRDALANFALVLPTESQWEYACRAGTDTPWWTGERVDDLRGAANLLDRQAVDKGVSKGRSPWTDFDDGWAYTAPVDTLRANPFGFHHMHGNVWEWCDSAALPYPLKKMPHGRSLPPAAKGRRVYRGGSFELAPMAARSGLRWPAPETRRGVAIGARAARLILQK